VHGDGVDGRSDLVGCILRALPRRTDGLLLLFNESNELRRKSLIEDSEFYS